MLKKRLLELYILAETSQ